MKLSTILIAGIGLSLLSGCASNLKITYDSDPPGAVLYQGQQKFGYTPYTLSYQVSDEDKKRGYKILSGTTVRWYSGATSEVKYLKADLNQYGLSQHFTFQRPSGIPGREEDIRFSLELERTRAMQRQAAAQEEQAAALRRQAAAREAQNKAQQSNIDYKCMSDCSSHGYLYDYCTSRCSY